MSAGLGSSVILTLFTAIALLSTITSPTIISGCPLGGYGLNTDSISFCMLCGALAVSAISRQVIIIPLVNIILLECSVRNL